MPENYQHLHFEVVGSTNDLCRIECKKKLRPTLITADKQTDGRGRNQKKWESPKETSHSHMDSFAENHTQL